MTITSVATPSSSVKPRPGSAVADRVRALGTLTARRMALSLRNPRAILLPLATPVLIAVVIAPASPRRPVTSTASTT